MECSRIIFGVRVDPAGARHPDDPFRHFALTVVYILRTGDLTTFEPWPYLLLHLELFVLAITTAAASNFPRTLTPAGVAMLDRFDGIRSFIVLDRSDRLKVMGAAGTALDWGMSVRVVQQEEALLPYALLLGDGTR